MKKALPCWWRTCGLRYVARSFTCFKKHAIDMWLDARCASPCTLLKMEENCILFLNSCYLETPQHLGHIVSRIFGCTAEGCVFLLLCNRWFFVQFYQFNFMIFEYDEYHNSQMDRGSVNPTQYLPWWLSKTTIKLQSDWSAPGFETWTSRIIVERFTTAGIVLFICA